MGDLKVGKCVLISYNWETGETLTTPFEQEHPDENIVDKAWGLKKGLEDDWPGWGWTVLADEAASEAVGNDRTNKMLGLEGEEKMVRTG